MRLADGSDGYVKQQLSRIKTNLESLKPACGDCIVVTIDGPAGSGKTTLAKELSGGLQSSRTLHMDDLYEGWDSTLTSDLTKKLEAILQGIKSESKLAFRPYNWLTNSLDDLIELPAPGYLILEGVGAGQSAIRKLVSMGIWIEVPIEEGLARVLKRDGPGVADHMPAFLVAQNSHFEKEGTKKSADYRLSGQATV